MLEVDDPGKSELLHEIGLLINFGGSKVEFKRLVL
jgi:hypothetical protein